jgi:hypothetical protein
MGPRITRGRVAVLALCVTVAIVAGAQAGWTIGRSAAGGSANAPITACVRGSHVYLLGPWHSCSGRKLTWNQTGARGLTGPGGQPGPRGAAGGPGTKGNQGARGDAGGAGVFGSQLGNASGLSCNNHAGTITLQFDATTGLERFVCT